MVLEYNENFRIRLGAYPPVDIQLYFMKKKCDELLNVGGLHLPQPVVEMGL